MTEQPLERAGLKQPAGYNHARLEARRNFLRFLIRYIGFGLLAKVSQVDGLENIPKTGPAILMINHIAFIDSIVTLHSTPRNIVPLAKIEVYEYPVVGIFPRLWEVIPVKREGVDRHAIRQALEVLAAGEIILLAPEGTRGPALQQGKEGVAYLAHRSGAPIIPVGITGSKGFPAVRFLNKRWKKPGAHVRFGRPVYVNQETRENRRPDLRKITDEAMYVLASLLPPEVRGVYSDLDLASRETIEVR